jgi:hypothetical protein
MYQFDQPISTLGNKINNLIRRLLMIADEASHRNRQPIPTRTLIDLSIKGQLLMPAPVNHN